MGTCATEMTRRRDRAHRRFTPLAAWALACVLAGAASCATPAPPPGPVLLHPVPPTAEPYALVQGAIVFTGPDFTVSARPWDYRLVVQDIAKAGELNPFGEGEEPAGHFLFIRVRLENRSTRKLIFNPMRATLVRDNETPLVPLENSDLVFFVGEDMTAAEARAKVFRGMSFDLTVTVPPGGTLERYLVFPAPEELTKPPMLHIDDLWVGPATYDLRFPFEFYPGADRS